MKQAALKSLPGFIAGFCLADFLVLFYSHWYFANLHLAKTLVIGVFLGVVLGLLIHGQWGRVLNGLSWYWIAAWVLSAGSAGSFNLARLEFTNVLDFEAAVVWLPAIILFAYWLGTARAQQRMEDAPLLATRRQLAVRRKLRQLKRRRVTGLTRDIVVASCLVLAAGVVFSLSALPASAAENPVDPDRPWVLKSDRHDEFKDPEATRDPLMRPPWPEGLPIPAHERIAELHYIYIENIAGGRIAVIPGQDMDGNGWNDIGKVLAPVSNINRQGFTASGWAAPGTVCATAVNAIHVKTDHDYENGRGVLFTLQPLEFADFDPTNYMSYFNESSSLFTDIPAGTGIFGGRFAPLCGAKLFVMDDEWSPDTAYNLPLMWSWYYGDTNIRPAGAGYVPKEGDRLLIEVKRRAYNPEYIQFDNGFGGLIWVKELGMDPYPIGQVLKPVAGVGRFGGTMYADVGRIRAAHPGVIDVSTSPNGEIGGFQIIPRDHAMSAEMTYTRTKTQWMVVGPLWALDDSFEGFPPLFMDYLYPDFTPAMNEDGTVNEDVSGAAAFLDRFTVRGRYTDADDPEEYILLRPYTMLNNEALKELTHVRVYFPRG